MKQALVILAIVLNLAVAFAAVDVTFNGVSGNERVNDFSMYAFDCLDASCSQVRDFSGVMLNGSTTTQGSLGVRFPDSMATPFGYALFATDRLQNFRPMELGPAIVHSNGNSFVFESTDTIEFSKIANCRALVHDMSVVNTARPNIPLVVAMDASLSAETVSAFRKVNTGIGFVPDAIRDWYSAQTEVVLEIVDESTGTVLHQDRRSLNLYADTAQRVEFSYTPRNDGRYAARIRSTVTDPVCQISTPENSAKSFVVLDEVPNDECYTLLNNLTLDNAFPQPGQTVGASFNKISNYADRSGVLLPIATLITIAVLGPTGETVYNNAFILGANPNAVSPVEQVFSWVAQVSGLHRITVNGIGSDFKCIGKPNHAETISTTILVDDPRVPGSQQNVSDFAFDVTFDVLDRDTRRPVDDARVRLLESGRSDETNNNGEATFRNLVNGQYTFKVTHNEYESVTSTVTVNGTDQTVTVLLAFDGEVEDADRTHVAVGSIRSSNMERVAPSGVLELVVNLGNDGDVRLDDARVTVTILELGVYDSIGPFDLKSGSSMTKRLFVQIPSDAQEGVYTVRITIGVGKHSRVLYRQVRVVSD